jgi:FkbM family methyltransferase
MTVFDIGAHVGFYTLLMARVVGDSGRVFAFEPWPPNLADCLAHLRMNRVANVVVVPAAVGNAGGLASFASGDSSTTGKVVSVDTAVRVASVTLDALVALEGFPVPDVVKVDVEGAESRVLEGAQMLLRRCDATWFIALHSRAQKKACLHLLADAGYAVSGLNGQPCGPSTFRTAPDEIIAMRRHSPRNARCVALPESSTTQIH